MIDLKLLRRDPELVAKAIRDKGMDVDLDALLALDARQTALKRSTEEIREARNKLSQSMKSGAVDAAAVARSKALRDELATLEAELDTTAAAFEALYKKVPNIPTSDTPIGASESDNVVANVWGEPTRFAFPPATTSRSPATAAGSTRSAPRRSPARDSPTSAAIW
jgi:seryl-tRNA synthetase